MKTTPRGDRRRWRGRHRGLALCASIGAATAFTHATITLAYAQAESINTPLVWAHEPASSTLPSAHATPAPAVSASPAIPVMAAPSSGSPFSPPSSALAGKKAYETLIETIAAQFDVDAGLLHAVIQTESGYDASAVSSKGAIGLMQVLPSTGTRFGFTDLKDPQTNLSAGAAYLRWLLNRFDGNLELALAAYNAGESAVERYGSTVPPYRETRNYVASVISRYRALAPPVRAAPRPAAPASAPGTGANHENQYARAQPPTFLPPLRLLQKLGSLLLSAPSAQSNAPLKAHVD